MKTGKRLLIGSVVTVLLGIAVPAEAQSCNDTTAPVQCNGQIALTSAFALTTGASLMSIVVKDISPINPAAQTVNVRVCDIGSLNDVYSAEIFRTASPKSIARCVTAAGGGCSVSPAPKPASASSDKLFLIVHVLLEDVPAVPPTFNVNFAIFGIGWESLAVKVLSNSSGVQTALPSGPGC